MSLFKVGELCWDKTETSCIRNNTSLHRQQYTFGWDGNIWLLKEDKEYKQDGGYAWIMV